VWHNYYAARMRLARELGTMKLHQNGGWIDHPASNSNLADVSDSAPSSLPPVLPGEWIELADRLPQESDTPAPVVVETSDGAVKSHPVKLNLPDDPPSGPLQIR
jgi:hypothetical protein